MLSLCFYIRVKCASNRGCVVAVDTHNSKIENTMSDEYKPDTTPGTFGWNELVTSDVEAAKAFYKATLGWDAVTENMAPGVDYTMFTKGERMVAGMVGISDEMGPVPPHWMAYVNSEDIEADVAKAKAAGATILQEKVEVPNTGEFAVIKDPQGAVFSLWKCTATCDT